VGKGNKFVGAFCTEMLPQIPPGSHSALKKPTLEMTEEASWVQFMTRVDPDPQYKKKLYPFLSRGW